MNLYIHDKKHDEIISKHYFGELNKREQDLINAVIDLLNEHKITDRYKRLVLAEGYERIYDEDFCYLNFHWDKDRADIPEGFRNCPGEP